MSDYSEPDSPANLRAPAYEFGRCVGSGPLDGVLPAAPYAPAALLRDACPWRWPLGSRSQSRREDARKDDDGSDDGGGEEEEGEEDLGARGVAVLRVAGRCGAEDAAECVCEPACTVGTGAVRSLLDMTSVIESLSCLNWDLCARVLRHLQSLRRLSIAADIGVSEWHRRSRNKASRSFGTASRPLSLSAVGMFATAFPVECGTTEAHLCLGGFWDLRTIELGRRRKGTQPLIRCVPERHNLTRMALRMLGPTETWLRVLDLSGASWSYTEVTSIAIIKSLETLSCLQALSRPLLYAATDSISGVPMSGLWRLRGLRLRRCLLTPEDEGDLLASLERFPSLDAVDIGGTEMAAE
ncbi:hypothetical protein HK405_015694, partial [Cladochytrium tenue]